MSSPSSSRRRGHSSRKSQSSTPAKSQQPQTSSPLFFRSSPAVGDQERTPRPSRQPPPGKPSASFRLFERSIFSRFFARPLQLKSRAQCPQQQQRRLRRSIRCI